MYTSEQISEMPSIPSSTLRRYCNQFSNHLSNHATKQRRRRFVEADIATLGRIRELLQQGQSPQQVNNLLSVVGSDHTPLAIDDTLSLIPSISTSIQTAIDAAKSLRTIADLHEQRLNDAENKLAEMANKLAELEKPWYQRIFNRKPQEQ